ncbi:Cyclin-dependent protein kinase inhibitor SMR13 [Linum grandiflorum]
MAPNTLRRSSRSRRVVKTIKTSPKSKPITKTKPPKRNPLQSAAASIKAATTSSSASAANEEQSSSIVIDFRNDAVLVDEALCSTPKGKKFRIPKIETCPPAPRKATNNCSSSSSSRRPIAFFSPPDLELFFFFARRHISV